MKFLTDNFLLETKTAVRLYHEFAKDQPIIDYHCHLDPKVIAENKQFTNMTDLWLSGDHYKWRGMRSAGIKEEFITGSSSDYLKFSAWTETVPMTMGNPLYHWAHLELRRPFGINTIINSNSSYDIWRQCNHMLEQESFSPRSIMKHMNVKMVGTTDDPIDTLEYHKIIADDEIFDIAVLPSWRPDRAFKIELSGFIEYMTLLSTASSVKIDSFYSLKTALDNRLTHFKNYGCRSADHGIETVRYADIPCNAELDKIFTKRMNNQDLTELEINQFSTAVQVYLGTQYSKFGWVMQLHMGAQRNNNTRMFNLLGADTGFDSIGDQLIAYPLSRLLDAMDSTDELPKTILYCLNPRDNEVIATMIGNFQGGGIPGKIQFGSGWWFNDQKDGMQRQIEQLSQLGLLSKFVGMLTDSRSFLSYTRHEYFRRILCNIIGGWVEKGEVQNDIDLLGKMVQDICSNNAISYFNLIEVIK